jgi:hypothetical protein
MTYLQRLQVPQDLLVWTNDGSDAPDWVRNIIVEPICPNGSFVVQAQLGRTRVHRDQLVILHASGIWVRSPEEMPELVQSLKSETPAELPIGPGKTAKFGSAPGALLAKRKTPFRAIAAVPPVIEWVRPPDLSVDPTYQRSIDNQSSQRLIASIAFNFDWRLCAPLIASKRHDGSRVIIDGQHRWAAVVRRGDIDYLPCCLFTYDSAEEEARMFILANRARKAMSRLDDFHAAIAAGDEDAFEIRTLVQDAGGCPGRVGSTDDHGAIVSRSAAIRTHVQCLGGDIRCSPDGF